MIIPHKLYNGQVEIMFNEDSHVYYFEDQRIPSVTTILSVVNKPALINWAANQAIDYCIKQILANNAYDELQLQEIWMLARKAHISNKQSAAGAGTYVHDWISKYIKGERPDMPGNEDLVRCIDKFLKWVEEYDVKFLASEGAVFSKKYQYTGTFDFIARIKGDLVMGDVKTSSGIWDEYWLQTAAYQLAREEEFPEEKYAYRGIIRIDRKVGLFQWKQSAPEDYDVHLNGFLACKQLYQTLQAMKKGKEY